MFDARKSYQELLENVDGLLSDVRTRVEPVKAATLETVTDKVAEALKLSAAACTEIKKTMKKRAEARAHKVAMAKRILTLAQQLAA